MLDRLLSHDRPRSRWLALALLVIVVGLAVAPFLFPGAKALSVAAKMLVFILLVASFDLLLGYTGIVSFAHTMFFGIGAYGVAIASLRLGEGFGAVLTGTAAALAVSLVLSIVIGLFSLRVKAIFYAMITLAVASAFQTLASQLSDFTGGESGSGKSISALVGAAPGRRRHDERRDPLRGRELLREDRARDAAPARRRDQHDLPGADDGAEPALHGAATRSPRCLNCTRR